MADVTVLNHELQRLLYLTLLLRTKPKPAEFTTTIVPLLVNYQDKLPYNYT